MPGRVGEWVATVIASPALKVIVIDTRRTSLIDGCGNRSFRAIPHLTIEGDRGRDRHDHGVFTVRSCTIITSAPGTLRIKLIMRSLDMVSMTAPAPMSQPQPWR